MPHGAPDFSNVGQLATIFSVYDLGELAARLQSIDTFDRRGNVLWLDDFESGPDHWLYTGAGAGARYFLSFAPVHRGQFAAGLIAGSTLTRLITMYKYFNYPALGTLGLEFALDFFEEKGILQWGLDLFDGSFAHYSALRYRRANLDLQVLDVNNAWQTVLSNLDLLGAWGVFHQVKLAVDFAGARYLRYLVNEHAASLTSYSPYKVASTTSPRLYAYIRYEGLAGQNNLCYIDDVILTRNE